MCKQLDGLQNECFDIFSREHLMNMKIATEPRKNSDYSKSDQFNKFSVLAQFFISYKIRVLWGSDAIP